MSDAARKELVEWLLSQSIGPMSHHPENAELCDRLFAAANMLQDDADLIRRVVVWLRQRRVRGRWTLAGRVMDVFCVGMTRACRLCEQAGEDPSYSGRHAKGGQ